MTISLQSNNHPKTWLTARLPQVDGHDEFKALSRTVNRGAMIFGTFQGLCCDSVEKKSVDAGIRALCVLSAQFAVPLDTWYDLIASGIATILVAEASGLLKARGLCRWRGGSGEAHSSFESCATPDCLDLKSPLQGDANLRGCDLARNTSQNVVCSHQANFRLTFGEQQMKHYRQEEIDHANDQTRLPDETRVSHSITTLSSTLSQSGKTFHTMSMTCFSGGKRSTRCQ